MKKALADALSALRGKGKLLIVLLLALAVLGVGYFDTYPTYFATKVTLSEAECSQVAALVAAHAFKLQNPDTPIPDKVVAVLDSATRLAKRTAKYIIEKNPDLVSNTPSFLYQGLFQSCVMSEGKAVLQ